MNRDIGHVNTTAARTAPGGFTRQSIATAPISSRGGVFQRNADQLRGTPAQRGAATDADDDEKEEPFVDRDEPADDDKPSGRDSEDDDDGNADTPKEGKKTKTAA